MKAIRSGPWASRSALPTSLPEGGQSVADLNRGVRWERGLELALAAVIDSQPCEGAWRSDSSAFISRLIIYDCDHLKSKVEVKKLWLQIHVLGDDTHTGHYQ